MVEAAAIIPPAALAPEARPAYVQTIHSYRYDDHMTRRQEIREAIVEITRVLRATDKGMADLQSQADVANKALEILIQRQKAEIKAAGMFAFWGEGKRTADFQEAAIYAANARRRLQSLTAQAAELREYLKKLNEMDKRYYRLAARQVELEVANTQGGPTSPNLETKSTKMTRALGKHDKIAQKLKSPPTMTDALSHHDQLAAEIKARAKAEEGKRPDQYRTIQFPPGMINLVVKVLFNNDQPS